MNLDEKEEWRGEARIIHNRGVETSDYLAARENLERRFEEQFGSCAWVTESPSWANHFTPHCGRNGYLYTPGGQRHFSGIFLCWQHEKMIQRAVDRADARVSERLGEEWVAKRQQKVERREQRERDSYVYLMRSGDIVKIGISVDPETRAKSLSSARGERVEVLSTWRPKPTSNWLARDFERALHDHLAAFRLKGEWFRDVPAVHAAFHALGTPEWREIHPDREQEAA